MESRARVNGDATHPALPSRLPTLTSLRFFAALLVFSFHASELYAGTSIGPTALQVGSHGNTGVSFFFVLSGFVLTWGYQHVRDWPRFFAQRVARIWPAHAVTWAGAIALAAVGVGTVRSGEGSALALVLLQAWVPDPDVSTAANGVSWTLSDELFFYALFPFVVAWFLHMSRRRQLQVAGGLLALVVIVQAIADTESGYNTWSWFGYFSPVGRLPEFLLGILVAAWVRDRGRVGFGLGPAVAAAVATYVAVTVIDPGKVGVSAVVPAFAVLVLGGAAADVEAGRHGLRHPVLVRLGELSFAFYLVHQGILKAVDRVFGASVHSSIPESVLATVVGFCLALAAAWALWRFVEAPVYAWARDRLRARRVDFRRSRVPREPSRAFNG